MTGRWKKPVAERFAEKWIGEPNSGCWLWIGAITITGYGSFHVPGSRWLVTAHRYSWELHNGPIPDGLDVLHKCDTPPCVNPDHLFLGSQQDNVRDMNKKKRHTFGEANKQAKLSDVLVREILTSQETNLKIARRLGVSDTNICNIRKRRAWKHVEV